MSDLGQQLAQIAALPTRALSAEWTRCFGEEAPGLPLPLLRRALAYRAQEQELAGLTPAAERQLRSLGGSSSTVARDASIDLKVGTRLMREWNGRLHPENGYLFEERCYASLSHIARLITGAHWSGLRFFGLKRRKPPAVRWGPSHS